MLSSIRWKRRGRWKHRGIRQIALFATLATIALGGSTADAGIFGRIRRCQAAGSDSKGAKSDQPQWKYLYGGQASKEWKTTLFGGEGEVQRQKDQVILSPGATLTGITYQGKFPKTNYEIELEAMRVEGIDFFCGLTFPVKKSHCSLIVGGWAGAVVGLSSIDDQDASANETTRYLTFKAKKWYPIRVRVTDGNISVWIENKQVVNQDIKNRKLTTRPEVDLNKPLGICAWQTKAAIRNIRWREVE